MPRRLALTLALCTALATPAGAVISKTDEVPLDLADAKAHIKAENYTAALAELTAIARTVVHADVYNLIGFTLRKSGLPDAGMAYYLRALALDPDHKGALEYQGELFLQRGQPDRARENLDRLNQLCPTGCEEQEDLAAAIAAHLRR